VSKETEYSVKRDLVQCQKRPSTVSKGTYYSVKRDLLQCKKRPTTYIQTNYSRTIYKNQCAAEPDIVRSSRERGREGEGERGREGGRERGFVARQGRSKRSTPATNSQKSVP